jgi:D-serine deaminase-like pyridoxal phosphate-dependent protein
MAIVSCGGTGTFPYCAEQQGISEIQAGGAIFSDVHYREHYHTDFAPALTILATVTSRPNPTRIILDAGRKAMSCDMAMPAPLGLPAIAEVKLSAEHGKIELAAPSDTPRIGDKIELICGYSDSTVFLHDQIVAVRKGRIEAIWPLLARGKLA